MNGLGFNASKCAVVHLRCDCKRKRWFVALKPQLFIDGNPVRNIKVGEGYKYLGLRTNLNIGQTSAKQNLNGWLGNLLKSVLKPQHRVFALRTVVIPRLLYELALEFRDASVLLSLDVLVRRFVRRCLHLPNDVPNSLIHAPAKDGGIGILSLTVAIPRLQIARFERIRRYALKQRAGYLDPLVLKLVDCPYWGRLVERTWQSLRRTCSNDGERRALDLCRNDDSLSCEQRAQKLSQLLRSQLVAYLKRLVD